MTVKNPILTKEIVLTEADYDRLKRLVDSPRYRTTHAGLVMALKQELDRSKVISANEVPEAVVTMRSQVRVRDVKRRESETYTLVYPEEADIAASKLSVLAPLGIALLGTQMGEVVSFDAPVGQRRLVVEEILYQPEAAGDLHL